MTRRRTDPRTLSHADQRRYLRRLQAQMQSVWDTWHNPGEVPLRARAAKERFEAMEKIERELLELVKYPKEEHDGTIPEDCESD